MQMSPRYISAHLENHSFSVNGVNWLFFLLYISDATLICMYTQSVLTPRTCSIWENCITKADNHTNKGHCDNWKKTHTKGLILDLTCHCRIKDACVCFKLHSVCLLVLQYQTNTHFSQQQEIPLQSRETGNSILHMTYLGLKGSDQSLWKRIC